MSIVKVSGGGTVGTGTIDHEQHAGKYFWDIPYFYVTTTGKTSIVFNLDCEFTLPEIISDQVYYNLYFWSFQINLGGGTCDDPRNYYFNNSGNWTLEML